MCMFLHAMPSKYIIIQYKEHFHEGKTEDHHHHYTIQLKKLYCFYELRNPGV